jgi:hypothetical protein
MRSSERRASLRRVQLPDICDQATDEPSFELCTLQFRTQRQNLSSPLRLTMWKLLEFAL